MEKKEKPKGEKKADATIREAELASRKAKSSSTSEAWLELPGRFDHPVECVCWACNQHRSHWCRVIERGTWTRERVLAYGNVERRKTMATSQEAK